MKEGTDFSGVTHYTQVDVQPGGINIQHVEHLYQADILKQMGIELAVKQKEEAAVHEGDEELFHFVHPELDEAEAWKTHRAVKRLVEFQKVPDICRYMKELKDKGKVLLPESPKTAYEELVRMGMPRGEGFSEKNFSNSYIR